MALGTVSRRPYGPGYGPIAWYRPVYGPIAWYRPVYGHLAPWRRSSRVPGT